MKTLNNILIVVEGLFQAIFLFICFVIVAATLIAILRSLIFVLFGGLL